MSEAINKKIKGGNICNKWLVSWIYKELLQIKNKYPLEKIGKRTWTINKNNKKLNKYEQMFHYCYKHNWNNKIFCLLGQRRLKK